MKALMIVRHINHLDIRISPSQLLFQFPSLSRENPKLLSFSRRRWLYGWNSVGFSSIRASSVSNAASYGGWDDQRLVDDSGHPGESGQLPNFLTSLGIDDKKLIFMFVLGVVFALAVSRVRFSSIVVFPASILVFAVGFTIGFVRSGSFSEVSVSKRMSKEEANRAYSDKLRNLVDVFSAVDDKLSCLRSDIQKAIDSNKITVNDLENYVSEVDSIKLSGTQARNVVEASIENVGISNNMFIENQKSSRKKKDMDGVGFELMQFIGGLFGEKWISSKSNKVKDQVKQGTVENVATDQTRGSILNPDTEAKVFKSVKDNANITNPKFSQDSSEKRILNGDEDLQTKMGLEDRKWSSIEMDESAKRFIDSEEYSYKKNRLQFTNNHRASLNRGQQNGDERWNSRNNLLDSMDFSVRLEHMETSASFVHGQMLKDSDEAYRPAYTKNTRGSETYRFRSSEERLNHEDDVDHLSGHRSEVSSSSSATVAEDVLFDKHLTKANDYLNQAKECIRIKRDEEHAELLLHNSAKLLSEAIAMKPMSLLAVGQLGNTYLLHGELKLHISRELRTLLSRTGSLSLENRGRVIGDDRFTSREEIACVLINVCEECEELLVKAGRKYRMALSIDRNDVRALYNWGLALSFRAQLIADIGPEAAFDADKVFLAAIDKFDAMMSKGNVYAPDALFRWGVALRQRSRLRPSNSKEKVKLLQQAKRLFEDSLDMNSSNPQAREALSSCISELGYGDY